MATEHIELDGSRIRLIEQGEGFPVLILHGWGSSSASWQEVVAFLAGAGYRVIVPDLPGFGQSDPPPSAWSVSDYVSWVQRLIDHLQLDAYALVAHSFGGRVAIKQAASCPAGCKYLILCASAGLRPTDLRALAKRSFFQTIAKTGAAFLRVLPGSTLPEFGKKWLYRLAGEHDYEQAPGVMKEVFQKAVQEDLRAILPSIAVPTLLIWGDRDRLTPIRDGYLMRERIPGARMHVIPGGRHNLYRQQPRAVADLIISFLHTQRD